jgi:ABC-type nitrate/sulfonate/bicarbonate transport system ATPase subunit/ABC-type proline/glycine betaine transport system permease subunit
MVIFRAVPFICLVPISILIFGLEESGKFFLVAWASATVTWVVVHDSCLNVPPHHIWRATSLGASKLKSTFKVIIPACSEGIFTGLKTSLSIGLIVVAVAEMSGVYERSSGYWWSEGLGYRMFRSLDEARNDLLLASILSFIILGILGDLLFRFIWRSSGKLKFRLRQRKVLKIIEKTRQNAKKLTLEWPSPSPVELKKITAGYAGKNIINDLSLKIPAGTTLSVVGPSGCGKTTLIRSIGHFTDDVFRVKNGVRIGDLMVSYPGPWVGIVMQEAPVFNHMTVWDNILFGSRIQAEELETTHQLALYLLREFRMEDFAAQKASNLSGGQRQRVALAMTLANRPNLLLLDEPFGALDAITRRQLQKFYTNNVSGKVTAVFVTHDIDEALLVGDFVRVGVEQKTFTLKINKENLSPHEWEMKESFGTQRAQIIKSLEQLP